LYGRRGAIPEEGLLNVLAGGMIKLAELGVPGRDLDPLPDGRDRLALNRANEGPGRSHLDAAPEVTLPPAVADLGPP
jgi:hypothetical protein